MYGGTVISISTRERARCNLAESDEIVLSAGGQTARILRDEDLILERDELDIARAALTFFGIRPGEHRFSLSLNTDVPMQAGMAGSTALVVATVGALDRYLGLKLHPWALAETARKVENRVMGVLCGLQDQHMAVFGGINYMDFARKEDLAQREDEPLATVEPLAPYLSAIPLIAAHTGIRHHSGVVHQSPRDRWLAGDSAVRDAFQQIAQIARTGKRALLAGDWIALGRLMDENHAIVAGLGGSGPQNERLIKAAREAGAYGAKLAGAGGGGTILALAEDRDGLANTLLDYGAETLVFPAPSPGLTVQGSIASPALSSTFAIAG
jgi:galactokinase/mevalonate kinase-like predicted kinase